MSQTNTKTKVKNCCSKLTNFAYQTSVTKQTSVNTQTSATKLLISQLVKLTQATTNPTQEETKNLN